MLKTFPKIHLIAVSGLSVVIGATLLVSPSSNEGKVERRFSPQPLPLTAMESPGEGAHFAGNPAVPEAMGLDQDGGVALDSLFPVINTASTESMPDQEAAPSSSQPQLEWKTFTVRSGDSLSRLFKRAGLNDRTMYKVLDGRGKTDELTKLHQGRDVEFGFDENGDFAGLVLHNSKTTKLKTLRDKEGFHTSEEMREPDVELAFAGGEIQTSFALAANRAGLNQGLRNKLSRIFGWEIDFSRDLRKGDRFGVLYEKQYLDGELIGYGRILAASFMNKGEEYSAALYTDTDGRSGYYAPDGSSMRKAFLRAPVDYRRISSHFDMNRKHPILNRTRPHEGTDFAASSGTPVRASGDGRISYVGRDGGYGKTIRIEHGNDVTTVYSHLRGYRQGMHSGRGVQQGDVIGYVGASGLATGPHLHYEYRVSGQPRNPLHVKLPEAKPIPDDEMQAFRTQANPLLAQLSDHDESFQVAMAEE